MGVGDGDPPEFHDLGVCQGASLLAALAGFVVTDTEAGTCRRKRKRQPAYTVHSGSSSMQPQDCVFGMPLENFKLVLVILLEEKIDF